MTFSPGPPWAQTTFTPLLQNQVHLWLFSIVYIRHPERFLQILPEDEAERFRKYRQKQHRDSFLIRRGFLRIILSRYLKKDPAKIRFSSNSFGKPVVVGNNDRINFSLSHSKELIILALTLEKLVGADIQYNEPSVKFMNIATRFFSDTEIRQLELKSPDRRLAAFYRLWTGKEAYIKGLGMGLSYGLSSFALYEVEESKSFNLVDPLQNKSHEWQIIQVPVPAGYCAALAVPREKYDIRYYFNELNNWPRSP
ncbi:4'-phosphopantetheinyl transferase superfamily protein [candidate division KSB1 bacterium]|nr:4'-phosphopantetheinyl transferase superfamily protein [candidate division KSB1 bacterium]